MINNETLVKQILEEKPIARKDDFILFGFVLKHYGVDLNIPLREFFQTYKKLGIPSFKSVERARRMVQAENPDLIDGITSMYRQDEEERYKNTFGGRKK